MQKRIKTQAHKFLVTGELNIKFTKMLIDTAEERLRIETEVREQLSKMKKTLEKKYPEILVSEGYFVLFSEIPETRK